MRFESQCFWLAKDAEFPEQYQDAFELDARRGIAAIADGVASALFSGPWARTLTKGTVDDPPQLDDPDRFSGWLARQRAALAGQIDVTKLTWYQRPKMAAGAMSTLLWIELSPLDAEQADEPCSYRMRAFSIGDCCLLHCRDGQVLRTFPMTGSSEFGLDPKVLVSIDLQKDHLLEFQTIDETCRPGDLLVLCTDAVGLWAMSQVEQGQAIAWDSYWDRSPEAWREEICELRRSKQMRYDDTTLVLLRLIQETVELTDSVAPAEPVAVADAASVAYDSASSESGDDDGLALPEEAALSAENQADVEAASQPAQLDEPADEVMRE